MVPEASQRSSPNVVPEKEALQRQIDIQGTTLGPFEEVADRSSRVPKVPVQKAEKGGVEFHADLIEREARPSSFLILSNHLLQNAADRNRV
jgi:hypothetical protein